MTIKQKLVVKKIVENNGNISKSMREVGYSPKTAKNPKNLTNSKGWQKLVDKYLPDDKLLQRHAEGLDADSYDMIGNPHPNYNARHKYVELGYKVKGKLESTTTNLQVNNIIPLLGGETVKDVSKNNSDQEDTQLTQED